MWFIRKKAIEEVSGFDTQLKSRVGNSLISNEDTLLHRKLQQVGYIVYYDPKIIVYHHIPSERLIKKWFIRRFFWAGYSHTYIYIKENEESSDTIYFAKAKFLMLHLYQLLLNILLTILALVIMNKSKYLIYFCRFSKSLGHIYGLIKIKPK